MGRPRGFVLDQVLEIAMTLFWEHGYDGVSISLPGDALKRQQRSSALSAGGLCCGSTPAPRSAVSTNCRFAAV